MAREMIRRGRFLAAVLCILGLISLAGCGGGPRRVPVSGTVTLGGKPLTGGVLRFSADASKGNNLRVSCTGPVRDGQYQLVSNGVERSDMGTGAPPGWYKVTVVTNIPGQTKIEIPDKYKNVEKTPLSIEIVDNPEPGHYDIKLEK